MRDDFTGATRRIVGARVGYNCSRPECRAATIGPKSVPTKSITVGCAAHITAASTGGPRYDETLSSEQRKSIENAIWLCETCAKLVDSDPDTFPIILLREWKVDAEREAAIAIGKTAELGDAAAEDVTALLKKFNPEATADFLLREGYETLRAADPSLNYSVAVEEGGITVTITSKDGEPISVAFDPVFPDTPEGRQKAAEFADFLTKGTPVELSEENVPFDALPAPIRHSAPHAGPMTLRIGSRRPRTIAATLIFKNDADESYEFPYIEFGANRLEHPDVVLSNAQQCIPFHVELRLSPDKRANFSWQFNLARKGFYWLAECLKFQTVTSRPTAVIVRDLDDGIDHLAQAIGEMHQEVVDPNLVTFVDRVLTVQRLTKFPIRVPDRPYPSRLDLERLEFIEYILATGRQCKPPEHIALTILHAAGLASLHDLAESRQPFECSLEMHTERVLDDVVPLGPLVVWCPKLLVHADDRAKINQLENGTLEYPQVLRFVAAEGVAIQARYPLWDRTSSSS